VEVLLYNFEQDREKKIDEISLKLSQMKSRLDNQTSLKWNLWIIILNQSIAIPPKVSSSFKQNFLPEEKYFYQKYSGQIRHGSEW